MQKEISDISKVVNSGACVGCGACAYAAGGSMVVNEYGEYVPDSFTTNNKDKKIVSIINNVCPSLNPSENEDVISERLYGGTKKSNLIGFYDEIFAGYSLSGGHRANGTSGGMVTWLIDNLIESGEIDAVIHAKNADVEKTGDPFYAYGVSKNREDVLSNSGTKYHVMELSLVLKFVSDNPGKYLFIGVPCFCKAVRRLQSEFSILKSRIVYVASLVCGHYKTINWSVMLGWSTGIDLSCVSKIKYRIKGENISPRQYYVEAGSNDFKKTFNAADVVGGKFNSGAMMLPACEYCDDVIGEVADITLGDAWLPKFEADKNGTNLMVVRSKKISNFIKIAAEKNLVKIFDLTDKEAFYSQAGGYRQRREGLSYRLWLAKNSGKWVPEKRVPPRKDGISFLRRMIYSTRSDISRTSRDDFVLAMRSNDIGIYLSRQKSNIKKLRYLEIAAGINRSIYVKFSTLYHRIFGGIKQ